MQRDLPGFVTPNHGFLESWARQGVLLLNTVLTVQAGMAHSHAHLGWETFTDRVIERINAHCQGVVFLLWGAHAQKKGRFIDRSRHHVLSAPHPSPLSAHRGFIGCGHFSEANRLLVQQGTQSHRLALGLRPIRRPDAVHAQGEMVSPVPPVVRGWCSRCLHPT
jgi:uracil-DNA glycosylase